MFRSVINDAKAAVGAVIAKYLARASVVVPFVVAAGFATAAITLLLVESFGAIRAFFIVAVGFSIIGVIAAAGVAVKEQEEEAAEAEVEKADEEAAASELVENAPALLASLLTALPGGPTTALNMARTMGRNWPLALLLAMIAFLILPLESTSAELAEEEEEDEAEALRPQPDGAQPHLTH